MRQVQRDVDVGYLAGCGNIKYRLHEISIADYGAIAILGKHLAAFEIAPRKGGLRTGKHKHKRNKKLAQHRTTPIYSNSIRRPAPHRRRRL